MGEQLVNRLQFTQLVPVCALYRSPTVRVMRHRIIIPAFALVLGACHKQPEPSSSAPVHGATDVGTPQTLANDGRYIPDVDRVPANFPSLWRHKSGRAPVLGAHAMVA